MALYKSFISKVLRYGLYVIGDHTVLPATYTQTIPAFPQPQGITALWLVPGTHSAYPQKDGLAELTWVAGYILR